MSMSDTYRDAPEPIYAVETRKVSGEWQTVIECGRLDAELARELLKTQGAAVRIVAIERPLIP